jgi:hypothetical protein
MVLVVMDVGVDVENMIIRTNEMKVSGNWRVRSHYALIKG